MFKVLFPIEYKNKRFLVLTDNFYRKTFLEIVGSNVYTYPTYEDFKELNEIYNNFDYTIKASPEVKNYIEKVRYKALYLALQVVVSGATILGGKWLIETPISEYKGVTLRFEQLYKKSITDRLAINEYFGNETVSRDDVLHEIATNEHMSDYYKRMAVIVLDTSLELDPEINLRVYYENLKKMHTFSKSKSYITLYGTANRIAYFSIISGNIFCQEEYDGDDSVALHELMHAVHNLVIDSGDIILLIYESFGFSLEEAMTERMAAIANGTEPQSYYYQGKVLSFLIDSADDFNYHVYNEQGVMGLINELKEKYPNVDVEYLVSFLDTYTVTGLNVLTKNNYSTPYECEEFVSELFNIALSNIDKDDPYLSFESFIKQFIIFNQMDMNAYNKYQKLYVNRLLELGYISEEAANVTCNMQDIICFNGNIYFGNSNEGTYLSYDNEVKTYNPEEGILVATLSYSSRNRAANDMLLNGAKFNNPQAYLAEILSTVKAVDGTVYNEEVLDAIFKLNLNNIKKDDLFGGLNNVLSLIPYDNDGILMCEKYTAEYDKAVAEKGYISTETINMIRNMYGFINTDEGIIPVAEHNYNQLPASSTPLWRFERGYSLNGTNFAYLTFGQKYSFKTIGEGNIICDAEVKEDIINMIELEFDGANKLIQYITSHPTNNIWNPEYLAEAFQATGLVNNNQGKALADGCVIVDGNIPDDMYVEIGFNENNEIGMKLYMGETLICRTFEKFKGETCKIPYKTYLTLSEEENTNIEECLSVVDLEMMPKRFLEYFAPNVTVDYVFNDEKSFYEAKFTPAEVLMVDTGEKVDYLRHIIIYSKDDKLYINIFGEEYLLVDNLYNDPYCFMKNKEYYYRPFVDCLEQYNILPLDGNTYHIGIKQIIGIAKTYINDEFSNGLVETTANIR